MAIGTTAAIIGSAALGAGASVLGSRQQSRAINQAQASQDASTQQNLALQERMFNQQRSDFEPFRQYGIQQANAMGEILGFNPVGMQAQGAQNPFMGQTFSPTLAGGDGRTVGPQYIDERGQVRNLDMAQTGGNQFFRPDAPIGPASFDPVGASSLFMAGQGQPSSGDFSSIAGVGGAGIAQPHSSNMPVGSPIPAGTATAPTTQQSQQEAARVRFEGSLFNDALQGSLGRAATGVDANMANMGSVYSGARQQAQANTAADLGMNALGMYTNFMMGAPNTAGAAGSAAAAGQYGANAGNLLMQQGQNQAQSAYNRAANQNALYGNLANLGGFALGAFGGGQGGGSSPAPGANAFNFRYGGNTPLFVG